MVGIFTKSSQVSKSDLVHFACAELSLLTVVKLKISHNNLK